MLPPQLNNTYRYPNAGSTHSKKPGGDFLQQFLENPLAVGAIAPSSEVVARTIAESLDWSDIDTLVELGPGTGVFTECLSAAASRDCTYIALELNHSFSLATRRKCPTVHVYNDSAASLPEYLQAHNHDCADVIVSGLPWTIFKPQQQHELMSTVFKCLKPGGTFISIVYLGARIRNGGRYFHQLLQDNFVSVERSGPIWRNLPPTLIFHCNKSID